MQSWKHCQRNNTNYELNIITLKLITAYKTPDDCEHKGWGEGGSLLTW